MKVNHMAAVQIWLIKNGEHEGTQKQIEFCKQVSRIYMSVRKDVPRSYMKSYFKHYVDSDGIDLNDRSLPKAEFWYDKF